MQKRKKAGMARTLLLLGFCECDTTHEAVGTTCQFCWVRDHPNSREAYRKLQNFVNSWNPGAFEDTLARIKTVAKEIAP